MNKQIRKKFQDTKEKRAKREPNSTDKCLCRWLFDDVDTDGNFAFTVHRIDKDAVTILEKILEYSRMTWSEIRKQTHDSNKSKHHTLSYEKLSKSAQDRIRIKELESYTDALFSFALNNKLRIIGIRDGEYFHVKWYDPQHKFCPSTK